MPHMNAIDGGAMLKDEAPQTKFICMRAGPTRVLLSAGSQ
jgi:hypothetical protein